MQADEWRAWIAHDPDPATAAELADLDATELAHRFSHPLMFGTAGLRGALRGGPDGMNLAVVIRASWALARVLTSRGLGGSTVVVGRDARHGSERFAAATAEVLAAAGFSVTTFTSPVPTPVVAFAVRHLAAGAGVQITASHNPPGDNGYKVYTDGGLQIISPTDREIEAAIAVAPPANEIARSAVWPSGDELIEAYCTRAAQVRRGTGGVRVALTPMHGVGGAIALAVLRRAGITDVHVVATQFEPDPDFPSVPFPNPEEPGATDALLALAADIDADVAVALDPDADRCAVGIPTPTGWRMLSGDETGWLLGDYLLSGPHGEPAVVASTVVSSSMLARIADAHGAHHVQTLTGFKWLARADSGQPETLVYAYEEAIGHCVDPAAVRDKDGISAAVLSCDLVAALRDRGSSVLQLLDDLALRYGVHVTSAVSARVEDAAEVMRGLRADPPASLGGAAVTTDDLSTRAGADRTDAVIYHGDTPDGVTVRVAVRPSGTEPKIKCYLEVRVGCHDDPEGELEGARARARDVVAVLEDQARQLLTKGNP